jgi:hypothetical protein
VPHTHPEKEKNREADSLLKGIITGAILGAGILWLLGSDNGKKLKKDLEEEAKDLLDKFSEKEELDEEVAEEDLEPVIPVVPLSPSTSVAKTPTPKPPVTPKPAITSSRRFFKRKS